MGGEGFQGGARGFKGVRGVSRGCEIDGVTIQYITSLILSMTSLSIPAVANAPQSTVKDVSVSTPHEVLPVPVTVVVLPSVQEILS